MIRVLVILLILVALFFIWKPSLEKQSTQTEEKINIENIDDVRKIEIIHEGETTFLSKENDTWLISSEDNIPADQVLVENLLSSLKEIKSCKIVSTNADKFSNFQLSEDLASQLKLYDQVNNLLFQIYIGKIGGPAYDQTYVRLPNSDNSLLVKENLLGLINPGDWKMPEPEPEVEAENIEE